MTPPVLRPAEERPRRNKHAHKPSNGFRFTVCQKCGATATQQRTCVVCGKPYCESCEAKKASRA